MAFQPANTLKDRTFVGLIVAQFLAGFNDQAIHASAMFYAIHQGALTEAQAISLMPILFYAPWAIFCTISGYLADRFSKTYSLVAWKFSEVLISLVLLGGFYLGSVNHQPIGPFIVLGCVFLMGTHAAFFAPAKYGAMPEVLQPHVLSRGNGVLESTTFLAAILGTVSGGFLSSIFHGSEYWIGVVILALSLIGSAASLMIAHLPPANPDRPFPKNLFAPLFKNLGILFRSKPLALSVLGIAFFIFMVAYMRQVMYMHGETRVPRWDDFDTSLVVASVALGVGMGAPLAGIFSGGKIELGLVPLGCFGMIAATLFAAILIDLTAALVVSLVLIGFFSGFYMVPLYTLLQHRAPKTTKGDLVATSNFINVIGAMAASALFFLLVRMGQATGLTPEVPQEDRYEVGKLVKLEYDRKTGRPAYIELLSEKDGKTAFHAKTIKIESDDLDPESFENGFFEIFGSGLLDKNVIVSRYQLPGHQDDSGNRANTYHYRLREADKPLRPAFDNRGLPRFLFLGAALMTTGILFLLVRKLPDFFLRTYFWYRTLGKFQLRAVGVKNLPTDGPVILATNCTQLERVLQLVSATDRYTTLVLVEETNDVDPFLRRLAQGSLVGLASQLQSNEGLARAEARAQRTLDKQDLLAVTLEASKPVPEIEHLVADLRQRVSAPIIPVYCGELDEEGRRVRVVFGEKMADQASFEEIRQTIRDLGEWIRGNDHQAEEPH